MTPKAPGHTKRIAALTSVRNGNHFLTRWVAHHGEAFGFENLFVIVDGHDQEIPLLPKEVNVQREEYVAQSRVSGDKKRAARASNLAAHLFEQNYDLVFGSDVDEFLVVDPHCNETLSSYLSRLEIKDCLSALGIDVARNANEEGPLDWQQRFLSQRHYGIISDRYTKTNILARPLQWGSGFHRVKGKQFKIDPHLFLFHFGSVDDFETARRTDDTDRRSSGWSAHQERRNLVSKEISETPAVDGDIRFENARRSLSRARSLLVWNKPRPLREQRVVRIPKRFSASI